LRNPRGFFVIVPDVLGLVPVAPLIFEATALVPPMARPDAASLPCVKASVVVDRFISTFMSICPKCGPKFVLEAEVASVCNHVGEFALRIAYSVAGETGVKVLEFEGLPLPPGSEDAVEVSVLLLG